MDHKKPVVNRRDFLKRSAVVGVGATAASAQDRKETKPGQFILTAWPMSSLRVRGRARHALAADEYL